MRVLILASIPFGGLRRRQQQVASGLARDGHDVLYLEPPRPFRSLIDPARFERTDLAEARLEDDDVGAEPGGSAQGAARPVEPRGREWAALRGAVVSQPHARLTVARAGIGMARMGSWGWAARVGWKLWSERTRRVIAPLYPDIVLIYHPALISAAREALRCPLVFECLDDFPSLVPSTTIAAAYEEALQEGLPQIDGFLTVNRYLLESWERYLRTGALRRVIEHGVDLTLFRPVTQEMRADARSLLGLDATLPVAGYLGRFDARISFADLESLLTAEPRLQLLLLGEVSDEGEAMLRRLPPARIHRHGPLGQERAAALLSAADFLVLPFLREPHLEALRGLKLYEYLATGLPVLASFRRGIKAFRDLLYLYTDSAELERGLRAALDEPADSPYRAARAQTAGEAAWDRRVVEIEEFLKAVVDSVRV